MIIINGAGSQLAKKFIELNSDKKMIVISRDSNINYKNVKSMNLSSNEDLKIFLENIEAEKIVWLNFQTIKFDELLLNTSIEQMQKSFEINFYKNFIAANILLPKMIKNRFGKFIFIDSVRAMMGDVGCAAYAVSKGANRPLMQSIVCEYSRFNITCNTIAIGFSDTPMLKNISPTKKTEFLKSVPGKKLVDPDDLNSTVNLILSNDSLNGQIINLDGGLRNSG